MCDKTEYDSFDIIFHADNTAELKPKTERALLELQTAVTNQNADYVMLQVALAKLKILSRPPDDRDPK